MVPIPDEIYDEDYTETVTVEQEDGTTKEELRQYKKNTNEQGLILINVPQVEQTEEIPIEVTGAKEGEGDDASKKKTKTVKRLVDEDQGHKALSIIGRDIPGI